MKPTDEKKAFRGPLDGQIEAEGQLVLLLRNYTPSNQKKKSFEPKRVVGRKRVVHRKRVVSREHRVE